MNDDYDYKQLSDDWRHRDRLTWQLPSVLIAVSGALITAVLGFDKPEFALVKDYLLWGGLFFAGLLTIALGQNLYFQTVAEDLMDAIKNGEPVRGSSIPKRRANGPAFRTLVGKGFVKVGSTGLFVLSAGLTGFLGFLISDLQFNSGDKFIWWIGTGIFVVGLTIFINKMIYECDEQPSNLPKKGNDDQ